MRTGNLMKSLFERGFKLVFVPHRIARKLGQNTAPCSKKMPDKAEELQLELGEILAKNMAKTATRQLGGRRLLFGEYLRSWSNLNAHYRR